MTTDYNPIGSSFDDWLDDEGITQEVTAVALKRVIAWQLSESMKQQHITKTELAQRMNTSRAALDRLLHGDDAGLTLATLSNAANALGKQVKIELVNAH